MGVTHVSELEGVGLLNEERHSEMKTHIKIGEGLLCTELGRRSQNRTAREAADGLRVAPKKSDVRSQFFILDHKQPLILSPPT